MKKQVSFDFDGTMSRQDVQDYAYSLIKKGIEVFILTARYNEMKKHLYVQKPCNEIVFQTANRLEIPMQNIVFTNMEDKSQYLNDTKVCFHLDDDIFTIEDIERNTSVNSIDVNKRDWKSKCNKALDYEN